MSTISVGRRPKRSAIIPNRNAPTGRNASVMKIASATAETFVWNCVAMALTQKVRMKKSKASSDQPRKQAMNVFRCTGVSLRKWPINSIEIPPRNSVRLKSPADASICFSISNQKSAIGNSTHARTRLSPTPGARFAHAHRLLVSRPARRPRPSQSASQSDAARDSARHRTRPRRPSLRAARRLSAPRHAAPLRQVRRRKCRVLLPWLDSSTRTTASASSSRRSPRTRI